MFCEECGTKNEKNAAFCEKCGHKLKEEKEPVKKVVKEKKPMSNNAKILTVVVIALAAILFGAYTYVGNMFKPDKVALKYFKAYVDKDADTLYETINIEESKFVSKELLKKSLKNAEKIKVDNYKAEKPEKSKNSLSTNVTINYVLKGSSREKSMNVKLTKKKSKKFLIFDDWSVDAGGLVAKDYIITVPKDGDVEVDGISLSDKYKEDSYSSYTDSYKIPSILFGNHEIIVKLKSGIKLSGEAKISGGSYGSFSSSQLDIESKTKKTLEKDIKKKVELLYESAIADKSFDDISESFDEDYRDDISYQYSNIKSGVTSYNKLKSIKINDVKIKSFYTDDDTIRFTVTMKYDYKIEYELSDDVEEYSKKDRTDTFYVDYKLNKKNYVMKDISSLVTYFSRY